MKHIKNFKLFESMHEQLDEKLKNKLLSIDGKYVKLGLDSDYEIERMLNDGELIEPLDYDFEIRKGNNPNSEDLFNNITINRTHGLANKCHFNSANYYNRNKNNVVIIMSGYALNYEDVWYQHSWLLKESSFGKEYNPDLIETTPANFKKYFGYRLNKEESVEFCDENY